MKSGESLRIGGSFRRPEKSEDETRPGRRPEKSESASQTGSAGVDYSRYQMTALQWLEALAAGAGLAGAAAYACYRSWIVFFLLLVPAELCVPVYLRKMWRQKRLRQLESQFKEAIQIISASLAAGLSVENAIASSGREMELMYGRNGMMCRELAYMVRQMNMNRPVEDLMRDFAERSGLEEVDHFARIFQIAKRSGGQLVPIIRRTVQVMDDRYQVKEEIRTLTASKQFEQKVMNAMPLLMILYIDSTSPGFFEVMYTTVMGRLIMTACLAVYLLSCWLARRILDIPMV